MTTRYFINISFKGTLYHGWQLQPNAVTVQEILEDVLSLVTGEKIRTTGAGRTDAGVHARSFYAHFDSLIDSLHEDRKVIYRLNSLLPKDISVNSLFRVLPDAHARFSALSRTYCYYISLARDPFTFEYSWPLYPVPDIQLMNEACSLLLRYNDFTSFARLHSDVKTNICNVTMALWERHGNRMVLTIKADRFLRNMVRAITGTVVDVGRGRLSVDEFEDIILARDRCRAGKSAPASGLFLEAIEYPGNIFFRESQ